MEVSACGQASSEVEGTFWGRTCAAAAAMDILISCSTESVPKLYTLTLSATA